jgi:predicted DNA-binding transcriptional regulator AlpA
MARLTPDIASRELNPEFYDKDKRFAAQFLGITIWTVDRYVHLKTLPHIKLNNRLVRFRLSDLIAFAESQRVA